MLEDNSAFNGVGSALSSSSERDKEREENNFHHVRTFPFVSTALTRTVGAIFHPPNRLMENRRPSPVMTETDEPFSKLAVNDEPSYAHSHSPEAYSTRTTARPIPDASVMSNTTGSNWPSVEPSAGETPEIAGAVVSFGAENWID